MLDFLSLSWDEAFEAGFARHTISGGRAASYREELTLGQLQRLEDVLAKPLERWGYEVSASRLTGSA
jgi:hypothetical protein